MATKKITDAEFDENVIRIVSLYEIKIFMSDRFPHVLILHGLLFTDQELLASLDRLLAKVFIQKPLKPIDIDMFRNSPIPVIFNDEKVKDFLLDSEFVTAERD
ncbi:MAG: hypothetical protein HYW77_01715 [Parcubacteria group bacterium]|nr:hypothetical protein [Parcubacteria group bacterium]